MHIEYPTRNCTFSLPVKRLKFIIISETEPCVSFLKRFSENQAKMFQITPSDYGVLNAPEKNKREFAAGKSNKSVDSQQT